MERLLRLRRWPVLLAAACGLACGCAATSPRPAPTPAPAPSIRSDPAAQQSAYALGLEYFGQENYAQARKAWLAAVRHGPSTPLGLKAAEHLRKVDRIIESLKEIDDDAPR